VSRGVESVIVTSEHPPDVSLGKIIAFEQEGLSRCASQRIGEDVAEIKAGGVASLAESSVGSSCLKDVLCVHGDDQNLRFLDQRIEFLATSLAFPGLDDEGGLEQGSG